MTPQEKKDLAYKKDHVIFCRSRHNPLFRKSWPLKKAFANRAFRRQVKQRTELEAEHQEDFPDRREPAVVRREEVRKCNVIPLREAINFRVERRIERDTWKIFRYAYNSTRDRERFAGFLASHIEGRTEYSRQLALYLFEDLDSVYRPLGVGKVSWDGRNRWLRAFFKDEPEWEERVLDWVSSCE